MRRRSSFAMVAISLAVLGGAPASVVGQSQPVTSPPAMASPAASPAMAGDPELEALFPTEIGGEATSVTSQLASDMPDPNLGEEFERLLAENGKALSDMSVARAEASTGAIYAIRIRGVDAATFAPAVLEMLLGITTDLQQTPVTIAGKEVTRLTQGPVPSVEDPEQRTVLLYLKDDVVWFIGAFEPALTEIIGKLP